jgi:flagellar hook-length control protein FliK
VQGANPTQAAVDMGTGTPDAAMPDGAFKEVLEKRMQAGDDLAVGTPTLAADIRETVADPSVSTQIVDPNRIASDAVVAFLARQPATSPPASAAASTASGAGADPLLQVLARGSLAEGMLAKGSSGATGPTDRSPGALAEASVGRGLPAAIDAGAGKPLPPPAADPDAPFRGLLAEVAAASRPADAALPMPVAADTLPPSAGGLHAPAVAPGPSQPADVRLASTQVPVPFGRPEWTNAMNERVTWLVGQRMQSADIQLNPPQLGPVEVRITIQNDQANLFFTSQSSAVREAIQAALPRLNEMLAQGGLSLGQTSVGAESFAGQQQASRDGNGRHPGAGPARGLLANDTAGASVQPLVTMLQGRAGIDMFV